MIRGHDVDGALAAIGAAPDVKYLRARADTLLMMPHRRLDEGDLYFVSNRRPRGWARRGKATEVSFAVAGREPELWHADTGTREPASYRTQDGRTIVPLTLAPSEAAFVVFRKPTRTPERVVPPATETTVATLADGWTISVQPGRGAPPQPLTPHSGTG